MELDEIFALISLLFFLGMIFFIFKKPKLMDKLEAVLICLLGSLVYGVLCADYSLGNPAVGSIFGIGCATFFVAIIFFSFRKPRLVAKWQAISLSLFGFISYGALWGACHMK